MKKYANVEEIRKDAIEVKDGMVVYWPQEGKMNRWHWEKSRSNSSISSI